MPQDFDKLRNFIAENRIEKAFESLKELSKNNSALQNEILTLAARFSRTRQEENLGMINTDDVLRIRSQINLALLELITDLENNSSADAGSKNEP